MAMRRFTVNTATDTVKVVMVAVSIAVFTNKVGIDVITAATLTAKVSSVAGAVMTFVMTGRIDTAIAFFVTTTWTASVTSVPVKVGALGG